MSEQNFEKPALGNIFAVDPEALRHEDHEPSRRSLLKIAGAGLVLGFAPLPHLARSALAATPETFAPNPYLIVAPDNTVTVIIKHLDKGQGAATGLATLVAEELDAEWSQIRTEFAPSDIEKYKNLAFGVQGVGGSTGLANSYEQYRTAGADGAGHACFGGGAHVEHHARQGPRCKGRRLGCFGQVGDLRRACGSRRGRKRARQGRTQGRERLRLHRQTVSARR